MSQAIEVSRGQNFAGGAGKTQGEVFAKQFQQAHAAGLARIAAGTDVLVARVIVGDEVLTVRADQVGQAMLTLHGTPTPGMTVDAKVEFMAMSADEFSALPDWQ